MREVQFEEQDNLPRYPKREKRESFAIQLVIRAGLARDERQAQYVLLIVAVIIAIIAYLLWPEGNSSAPITAPAAT
jgi:hypothetical protein